MDFYAMFKDALSLAKKSANLPLIEKIIEMQEGAQELSQQIVSLQRENESLKDQLREMGNVDFMQGIYWKKLDQGLLDGPFDPLSWDTEKKLVRLTHARIRRADAGGLEQLFFAPTGKGRFFSIPKAFYDKHQVKNAEELPTEAPPPEPEYPRSRDDW